MAVAISSENELEAWLEDKPREWAQAIALRAALRVLPMAVDPAHWRDRAPDPNRATQLARALVLASAAAGVSADDPWRVFASYLGRAAFALDEYIGYAGSTDAATNAATFAAKAASAAASTAYAAAHAIDAAPFGRAAAGHAAAASREGSIRLAVARAGSARDTFWAALSADCTALQDGAAPAALLDAPLWIERPDWFQEAWGRAAQWLSRPEHGFAIWREWYFGRLEGLPRAFERFDAAADEAFYRWIIEQDDDWWKRNPTTVNADIAAKVEQLRRSAPLTDEELAQNPAVINFALDGEGRTVLAPEALPNGLQDDADARDTHSEIVRLIGAARLSCDPGRTQATDMLGSVDLFAEVVGSGIEDVRPRLFVLRGKELIRQFEDRQREDSLATPLSAAQIDAFAPLVAAVQQLADEDPKLRGLWQGPEGGAPALERQQITALVDALKAVGQTTPEAHEALTTAAGQVRPDASPSDPARRSASEMLRNVFRGMGKKAKDLDEASKAAERWMKFGERGAQMWTKLRDVLSSGDVISQVLNLFKDLWPF